MKPSLPLGVTLRFKDGQPSKPVVGLYASRKYDGYRATWVKGQLYTRGGLRINAPESFTKHLPRGVDLDGELIIKESDRAKLAGVIRDSDHPRWREALYMVFDVVDPTLPLSDRVRRLATLGLRHPAHPVKHVKLRSLEQLRKMYRSITARGGEGVVLRAGEQRYRGGRTNSFLKVKNVAVWDN